MKTKLLFIFFIIVFAGIFPKTIKAAENSSASSAVFVNAYNPFSNDIRVQVLRKFLEHYDSPLAPFAKTFVESADENNLDWKLVAAISGLESTFGQQIPVKSYNAWGWGVYGDNVIRFASWEEGIKTISKGLRERYIKNWGAENIYQIGAMYAASPTWASRIVYLMGKIEEFKLQNPRDSLPITI